MSSITFYSLFPELYVSEHKVLDRRTPHSKEPIAACVGKKGRVVNRMTYRKQVEKALRDSDEFLTRAEIGERSNVKATCVGTHLRRFIAEGLVEMTDEARPKYRWKKQ